MYRSIAYTFMVNSCEYRLCMRLLFTGSVEIMLHKPFNNIAADAQKVLSTNSNLDINRLDRNAINLLV
jgi:hypothetical protein